MHKLKCYRDAFFVHITIVTMCTHLLFQGLLFLLCALCPPDVSKVRVGKLSPYGIEVLRHISDFLKVKFNIKPDPVTNTVILKCVGCGLKNLSRKAS